MYENPSAGKFKPPPEPPSPRDVRDGRWRYAATLVIVAAPVVRWLYSSRTGWTAALVAALMFTAAVCECVRVFVRPPSDPGPYTEYRHLTR